MNLPYLSEEDVSKYLDYPSLIDLMADAMVEYSSGSVISPVRQMLPIEKDQRYLGVMPIAASAGMGAKLVAFYPKNAGTGHHTHLGIIALFDPEFGTPLAFMDARLITEMRTAANSAAVTKHLAPKDSKTLAVIGSGIQGKAHLEALSCLYNFDEVSIWSRTETNARAFADAHGARFAPSIQDAVQDADIIAISTSSQIPVLQGQWLKPGCHINSVGSPRPDWRELDDEVMANTIVVDSKKSVLKESGDVILSGADIHAEAGDIISGKIVIDRAETTVFKSVGIAIQDIVSARMVYDRYKIQYA